MLLSTFTKTKFAITLNFNYDASLSRHIWRSSHYTIFHDEGAATLYLRGFCLLRSKRTTSFAAILERISNMTRVLHIDLSYMYICCRRQSGGKLGSAAAEICYKVQHLPYTYSCLYLPHRLPYIALF